MTLSLVTVDITARTHPIPLAAELGYVHEAGWLARIILSVQADVVRYVSVQWPETTPFAGVGECTKAVFRRWAKGGRPLTTNDAQTVLATDAVRRTVEANSAATMEAVQIFCRTITDEQLLAEASRRGLIFYEFAKNTSKVRVRSRPVMLDNGQPAATMGTSEQPQSENHG